jgi:hypothetical protein
MGIRLYPRTEDPSILERLCGVPSGTYRRFNSVKAKLITTRKGVRYYLVPGVRELVAVRTHEEWDEGVDSHEFSAMYADEDVWRLKSFLDDG